MAHLFEFLEENYLLEWWDCDFAAWYYEPYRARIAAQFKVQQAAWQAQQQEKEQQQQQLSYNSEHDSDSSNISIMTNMNN